MSKYTTEVRFICETHAGLENSAGVMEVDRILEESWDKIFTTKCNFFDDDYRKILCKKILKHYYLREIGTETVGIWKLWINTRLEEIMPYYNQLYESELIKFNPLYDTDVKTTHNKKNQGETSEESASNKELTGEKKYDKIGNKDVTTEDVQKGTKNSTNDTTESGTTENEKSGSKNTSSNGSSEYNKSGNNNDNTTGETSSKTITKEDKTETLSGTTTQKGKNNKTGSGTETTTNSDIKYDLYSDTPQGALTGVENENYLTNARKTTDKFSGNVETSSKEDGTSSMDTIDNKTITNDNDITANTTGNYSETGKGSWSEEGGESHEDTGKETTSESGNGSHSTTGKEVYDESTGLNRDITTKESWGEKGNETTTQNEDSTGSKNGTANSTEDYLENIIGKRGTASFSKMLMEYRETFLNIDMQVINEFNDLFMVLW